MKEGMTRVPREAPRAFHGTLSGGSGHLWASISSAPVCSARACSSAPRCPPGRGSPASWASPTRRSLAAGRSAPPSTPPTSRRSSSWSAWDTRGSLPRVSAPARPSSNGEPESAFGTSHDEQQRLVQPELGLPHVFSNGTGRAENFALLVRLPVTAADSLEMAGEGRNNRSTDVINIGGENQELTEARDLSSQRIDAVARLASPLDGARGRGGFPVDQARRATTRRRGPSTMPPAISSAGKRSCAGNALPGRSSCTASTSRGISTCIGRAFRTFSTGTRRRRRRCRPTGSPPATPGPGRSSGYPRPTTARSCRSCRSRSSARRSRPSTRGSTRSPTTRRCSVDLAFRYAFSPAIRARVGARLAWGDETVTLTDSAGTLPTQTLDVLRRGIFGGSLSDPLGSPEFTFFIGADFSIGAPKP